MIKKKKKKHDKIVLLAKSKLNSIEVLISRTLIDSCISHDEFVSVNNMLREHDDMKEEIKTLETSTVHQRFCKTILSYCLKYRKIQKAKTRGLQRQIKEKKMLLSKFASM